MNYAPGGSTHFNSHYRFVSATGRATGFFWVLIQNRPNRMSNTWSGCGAKLRGTCELSFATGTTQPSGAAAFAHQKVKEDHALRFKTEISRSDRAVRDRAWDVSRGR